MGRLGSLLLRVIRSIRGSDCLFQVQPIQSNAEGSSGLQILPFAALRLGGFASPAAQHDAEASKPLARGNPALALAPTGRTATAPGGAERNPGSPHPMRPRPNGPNRDYTNPAPCAPSGHRGRCVDWSPGFHPVLAFTCCPFGARARYAPAFTRSSQFPVASRQFIEPRGGTRLAVVEGRVTPPGAMPRIRTSARRSWGWETFLAEYRIEGSGGYSITSQTAGLKAAPPHG